MTTGVYAITNTVNGHRYIGSAVNVARRWGLHLQCLRNGTHKNEHLQRSYRKHGEGAFRFEVIEECETNQLILREQWFIDCMQPEYNICRLAASCLGVKRTPETCARISVSNKGRKFTSEHCAKLSVASKGHLPPTRKGISPWNKGKPALNKGQRASTETRAKISAAMMGNTNGKGHKSTEEQKAKMSAARKAWWARESRDHQSRVPTL